ncbi:MAG: ribosome biogenesis GTP-binding protein YsxC [Proteobacteria bacterium]|nr:ribosome biogenesis GTP-binding protein YsxC [Pseudomonadota bacterium]
MTDPLPPATTADFVIACGKAAQFPDSALPEVAIAGRSNCGKSALINALTGRHRLAHSSGTPGRTRQIVYFAVQLALRERRFHLVDLPGYGWARVPQRLRGQWGGLISTYIEERPQLSLVLLLIDIRRAPAQEEHDLLEWCALRQRRTLTVLTKADKLSKAQRFAAATQAQRALSLPRPPLACSVTLRESIAELRRVLLRELELAAPAAATDETRASTAGGAA